MVYLYRISLNITYICMFRKMCIKLGTTGTAEKEDFSILHDALLKFPTLVMYYFSM